MAHKGYIYPYIAPAGRFFYPGFPGTRGPKGNWYLPARWRVTWYTYGVTLPNWQYFATVKDSAVASIVPGSTIQWVWPPYVVGSNSYQWYIKMEMSTDNCSLQYEVVCTRNLAPVYELPFSATDTRNLVNAWGFASGGVLLTVGSGVPTAMGTQNGGATPW